ncbi:cadherin domain-containing protein [Sulfurimonas sp. HSL3-7]|uniref:cadherin domain-containing protein n=1 Tax=Sulfonitrofixus jiaomeiensis TaxID=3131938 RepID=UPI0031F7D5E4
MKTFYLSMLFAFLVLSGCSSNSSKSSNDKPTLTEFSGNVAESAAVSSVIGSITVDAGDSSITAIALSGTGSTDFSVDTNGTITVANALDFETQADYNLTAVATNAGGESDPVSVTIAVTDVPDVVPVLAASTATVAENTAASAVIGTVTITSSGDAPITGITLSGNGAADFAVAADGTITVVNAPDFETRPTYLLTAEAVSNAGTSASVNVTITVTDVADVAPILAASTATVIENNTTVVGSVIVTSSGDTAITDITLTGTGATDFAVATDGTITVVNVPDFETQALYNLQAVATNEAGGSAPVAVTITVTNDVESVPVIEAFTGSIAENSPIGTVVGDINISGTGDAGIVDSIALSSADFKAAKDGTITVAGALDYETTPFYSMKAIATNAAGGSTEVDVNITINNVPDVPPTLQPFTLTIADGTSGHIGDINISDSGESTVIHGISLTGIGAEDFTVTPEGNISTTGTIDYKTRAIYKLTAVATSDAGDSAAVPVTIMVDIKRTAPAPETQDYFGSSVAVDGAYVVVGAEGNASKAGMAYVLYKDVTGTYSQVAELNASDATLGDKFGISVAISGDYVVVGAQLADTNATNAGAAYVFKRNAPDNNYTEIALLTASDPAADDHFGFSVAIDGAYVIVGADNKSSSVDPVGPSTGAAYIFKNNGDDTYTEVNKLTAFDHEPSDYFGWSVDINGDHAIVGAWSESMGADAVISAGAAYVYKKDAGTGLFNHADKLMAPLGDAQVGDNFGWSVGIGANGEYAVVGAYHDNANQDSVDKNNTGAAYIFKNNGDDTYTQTTKLAASDAVADDLFGSAVSISGNYVLVGAKSEDPASDINGNRGAAYLFQNDGTGVFTEILRFKAHDTGAGDYFGYSVAISGSDMVVGARSYTENIISEMGTVYLFNFELK